VHALANKSREQAPNRVSVPNFITAHLPANNFATFLHVVNNGFADATDRSLLDPREDKATREVARGLALTPEIIEKVSTAGLCNGQRSALGTPVLELLDRGF